jgi:hypothetical protein
VYGGVVREAGYGIIILMDITELEKLLKNTKYERFIGSIYPIELKKYVYNDLFKIGNEDDGYFVLKLRNSNRKDVVESIKILETLNDPDDFILKYNDIMEKDGFLILVSDWLYGVQPIDNDRNLLPLFFEKLAILNKNNIGNGPFTSMYADGKYFNTINELVDFEINYHKYYFKDIVETKYIVNILNELKNGIATIILEDMNTGNLLITEKGECKFIDTEWIINGLNLYQFEKIDYFGFEENKWYNINEEAKDCYIAYFKTMGINFTEANEQIRAFELLQVLRTNTYLKYSGKDNDDEIKRRIKIVMEKEKYIRKEGWLHITPG